MQIGFAGKILPIADGEGDRAASAAWWRGNPVLAAARLRPHHHLLRKWSPSPSKLGEDF